jgi:hypothetical protein
VRGGGGGVRETAAGFAGREGVCGVAVTLAEKMTNAIRSIKPCRELRMSRLRGMGALLPA